jgi:hypothetical protein
MPRFTRAGTEEQLIQDAGCQLLYLPPYSPDLNKIEQCWAWLKSRIRKKLDQFDCLRDARRGCLVLCVLTALVVAIIEGDRTQMPDFFKKSGI